MIAFPRLYAVADASFGDPVRIAQALFQGGASVVQVRNKTANSDELLSQVERILGFAPRDAWVIVNDRVDIARITGANGVHLGQDDLPPDAARRILGPDAIVGLSTHNTEQVHEAVTLPVNYIAIGPIFRTSTKSDSSPILGIEGLRSLSRMSTIPVVAIGGITRENAPDVFAAGVQSVAVIRDLLDTSDIAECVRSWIQNQPSRPS
jgi:thiamine-phosphate pyrophosphorylase